MAAVIHTFPSLPSTNTTAAELAAKGAAHGEIVRAHCQTAGRGRLGKAWCSPADKGLYFSIIVRPRLAVEDYPKLTMVTGVAIAVALEKLCGVGVLLKWPNDIVIDEQKCAGILCEAHLGGEKATERFAIIGIGLNVNTARDDLPEELRSATTSLLLATGRIYAPDTLLGPLADAVLGHLVLLEQKGFQPLLRQWRDRDYLKGKWLRWLTHAQQIVYAQAEGPDEHGSLLVRDEAGVVHRVLSGDISLAQRNDGAA